MDGTVLVGGVSLTALLLGLGEVAKVAGLPNRWVPLLIVLVGAALSTAYAAVQPGFTNASLLTAAIVGVATGLSAGGVYGALRAQGIQAPTDQLQAERGKRSPETQAAIDAAGGYKAYKALTKPS